MTDAHDDLQKLYILSMLLNILMVVKSSIFSTDCYDLGSLHVFFDPTEESTQ